jgi:cleavage and polyadenylation specificity factor subunit 1
MDSTPTLETPAGAPIGISTQQHAVSLKLPPFWVSEPDVWFAQSEAQFGIKGVTADTTRYYYVVSALDQGTATRLLDLLRAPLPTGKYETIKKRLTDTFGLSRRQRAARLLHLDGLGDRKPSALMDEILSLAGDHSSCLVLEQIFLEQLPDDMRLVLADQPFEDLRALAAQADKLWESSCHVSSTVATAVTDQDVESPSVSAVRSKLSSQIPDKRKPTTNVNGWCFYHDRWGANAKRCRAPCSFPGNGQAGRQ